MNLIINGRKAVIKEGSSFDYVSENRSFSDADDYTLSITLPLAGCPENLAIFGHVNRMDADSRHIVLEASIVDRDFFKNGVVTLVDTSEVEAKVQFLEGRSVQNFLTTFDDVYINELPLGSYPSSALPATPASVHGDFSHGASQVALPWVYDDTGDIQNEAVYDKKGQLVWSKFTTDTGKLSYQPYLIVIARRICQAMGYTCDFTQWENSGEASLLICNTLPAAWDMPQYATALPHWSVSEFFDELEKILVCEFDIDHRTLHISMKFSSNTAWDRNVVRLENIVDSFSSEVAYEDELCEFKGIANIRYRERSDSQWKFEQCQWLVDMMKKDPKLYLEFPTTAEYAAWYTATIPNIFTDREGERGTAIGSLVHIVESDRYIVCRVVPWNSEINKNLCLYRMVDLNMFGDVINVEDSDNEIELACVPARIDVTDADHGLCLFLAPSGYSGEEDLDDDGIRQPIAYSALLEGEPRGSAEYYDKIYLAYWDGHGPNGTVLDGSLLPPCPAADERFSLRKRYSSYMSGMKVNSREKLKVSWLGSSIPDVRSVFHIQGKRYLCEKITATFTENGMSQLLKGEFYPITDN